MDINDDQRIVRMEVHLLDLMRKNHFHKLKIKRGAKIIDIFCDSPRNDVAIVFMVDANQYEEYREFVLLRWHQKFQVTDGKKLKLLSKSENNTGNIYLFEILDPGEAESEREGDAWIF